MITIYKYRLNIIGVQEIEMPLNAQILSVQMQDRDITLWALVNTELRPVLRCFRVCGTGYDIRDKEHERLTHIGTVQSASFVLHVFERKEL